MTTTTKTGGNDGNIRVSSHSASFLVLRSMVFAVSFALLMAITSVPSALALSSFSSFHGARLHSTQPFTSIPSNQNHNSHNSHNSHSSNSNLLVMRKQKASDKRTARMQRGLVDTNSDASSFTPSPLSTSQSTSSSNKTQILSNASMTKSKWKQKKIELRASGVTTGANANNAGGGRGRARKRLKLYNSLASYHSTFLDLVSLEYQMEESEVIQRLESSIANPFLLETSGHALFDIHPQRRGNLFSDEVYRLEKSADATTIFFSATTTTNTGNTSPLPPNHKFARNDVVVMTLQPRGTGDFLGTSSLPTQKDAVVVEARVLNVGPSYLDVAVPSGKFLQAFGPASNNIGEEGRGDPAMRIRVDRFFSDVPFSRMVAALGQLTSVSPEGTFMPSGGGGGGGGSSGPDDRRVGGFQMDALLKEAILSTFAIKEDGMLDAGMSNPGLGDLPKKLAKPPLPSSNQLANQVMSYIKSNPNKLFPKYNEPQLTAIRAALTRRLTLIQGPPGTGKTTTAGSIAFGFVHQCRSLSPQCKVLATAFSNVGADNLAEQFLKLGLKVVRVGKPSGVSETLWIHTLDAAVQRDENAQRALEEAKRVTARATKSSNSSGEGKKSRRTNKGSLSAERAKRDAATEAVKASIQACNIAATRALREADVIVATSIGAADAQLLAACGIYPEDDDATTAKTNGRRKPPIEAMPTTQFGTIREFAPDNLPPLSTPFVIIDEACQSVEPASLVPIVATNSCRSLVMLGDPCQLPPTVRSDASSTGDESALSISLMSRLAATLPPPVTVTAQKDDTPLETKYLQSAPTRKTVSKVTGGNAINDNVSYRRRYSGSLLLSVQYRMHPSIAAFSSAIFYDGLLSSPSTLGGLRRFPRHLDATYPSSSNSEISVRFVQVGGRNNENKGEVKSAEDLPSPAVSLMSDPASNKSYSNIAEARLVVEMITSLLGQKEEEGEEETSLYRGSIGVVTPYSSQVALIKSMMARDEKFRSLAQTYPHEIEVKSVDAYQGRERDLIIFSAVRSNRRGKIGFLTDWRRMNVALTRAKNGLIVLGDAETLKEGDKHWNAFIHWCEKMDCFVDDP
eukprot:CAMPEP_0183714346 /NCGR_PEP_ID=MMETSP0737-20130205/8885_1 /TAXON_ID=385413 /ORGANISM="Thalassiosira miniscula, Strain CCMP1093" /LENGTH=1079 /DNA_ID=CAMNT_0025943253 /DNA_START=214 /DNA_END=3453 /DNA_ORIENTATION=+